MKEYQGDTNLKKEYIELYNACQDILKTIDNIGINLPLAIQAKEKVKITKEIQNELKARKVFKDLINDFVLFMDASLSYIKAFKPQIAFSLARKPLFDDVYYIEKLYLNSFETVELIMSNNLKSKDITMKNLCENYDNMSKIEFFSSYYNSSLKDIKLGKNHYSLKSICDRASHLVTSSKGKECNPGELNFLFLTEDIIKDNVMYYLKIIPYILFQSALIIEKTYEKFLNLDYNKVKTNTYVFQNKYLYVSNLISSLIGKSLIDQFNNCTSEKEYIKCPYCNSEIELPILLDFDKKQLSITCKNCNKIINLPDYVF